VGIGSGDEMFCGEQRIWFFERERVSEERPATVGRLYKGGRKDKRGDLKVAATRLEDGRGSATSA